jgi:pimeloyl-ACP methyl ester carboxylesterase
MSTDLMVATVTSADGTRISYDSVGEGPPLVLVAGATQYRAVDETTPKLQALLAEGGFTVITYDRRGRGESGDTLPYAPEREFEDLEALVAAAGGEAAVFGMSSGAVLAVEAAARGVAMSSLVVYEPPCLLDHEGPQPIPDYIETVDAFVAAGKPATPWPTSWKWWERCRPKRSSSFAPRRPGPRSRRSGTRSATTPGS